MKTPWQPLATVMFGVSEEAWRGVPDFRRTARAATALMAAAAMATCWFALVHMPGNPVGALLLAAIYVVPMAYLTEARRAAPNTIVPTNRMIPTTASHSRPSKGEPHHRENRPRHQQDDQDNQHRHSFLVLRPHPVIERALDPDTGPGSQIGKDLRPDVIGVGDCRWRGQTAALPRRPGKGSSYRAR
jgi:hypothetical protein